MKSGQSSRLRSRPAAGVSVRPRRIASATPMTIEKAIAIAQKRSVSTAMLLSSGNVKSLTKLPSVSTARWS